MVVRELVTKLGFKTDTAALGTFEKNVDSAKSSVLALTAAIAAAATAVVFFVRSAAKAGDRLDKLRDTIGFTTDDYQRLEGAANLAGIENESFAKSLQLFSRAIGMAKQGMSEYIKEFAILGINMRGSNGQLKDNKELLLDVADAFQNKVTNSTDRATIAQILFGRAGFKMINFLIHGRKGIAEASKEFEKYAFILDKKAIKQSQEFTDRQFLLSSAFKSLKNEIGVGMMPILTKLINKTLKWIAANKKLITGGLIVFFKAMIFLAKKLADVLGFVVDVVKAAVDIWKHLNDAFGMTIKLLTSLFALQILAKLKVFKNLIMGGFGLAKFIISPIGLITAAIVALLLVLDDLAVYLTGGKSVIGIVFKKFPMVKKVIEGLFKGIGVLIKTMIIDPFIFVKNLIESIIQSVEFLMKKGQSIFGKGLGGESLYNIIAKNDKRPGLFVSQLAGAQGGNTTANNRNINFNTSIALTVPAGTQEMQQSFIRQAAEQSFEPILQKKLREALTVFPEVEQ